MEKNKNPKVLHIINEMGLGGAEVLLMESLYLFAEKSLTADLLVLIARDKSALIPEMRGKEMFNVTTLNKENYYDPLLVFKLMPHIRKYDIVHVHLFPSLYWVVLAKILSFSKVKLVFTEHSTNNKRMNKFLFSLADRLFYSFYRKIITISEDVDIVLKKHLKFKDSRFKLIHNGINLRKISKALPYPVTDFFPDAGADTKIIMMVAGFKRPKDHETLIRAISILPAHIKLLLAGNGDTRPEAENLVSELNLQDRVKFLGARKDVPDLLKTADILVLSSKYEGLSLSSVEGMAAGKPFIATEVPGLIDVVKNAGLLFPFGDEQKLVEIITQLLSDRAYYNEIAARCVEKAKSYDIEQMINKEIELYKSIV
ncbi:MAG: glycosyltransferase [Taibaiella sp.]|jgi:glycosyltransferase involved in cell wall biosynthesis